MGDVKVRFCCAECPKFELDFDPPDAALLSVLHEAYVHDGRSTMAVAVSDQEA